MITPIQLFFFVALILWGLYCIVNRICKCVERAAFARAFGKVGTVTNRENLDKMVQNADKMSKIRL